MTATGAFDLLKPFLWLAAAAFLVGFVSYLTLGRPAVASAHAETAYSAPVAGEASWPAASDEWVFAKEI
jgi:hypothetical protein